MAAHKGNQYWKLREKSGRDKILTPEELFLLAYDYKEHVDQNPIEIEDNKGTKNLNKVKLNRPYNWAAFELFVFEKTGLVKLEDYRKAEGTYKDFSEIIHVINNMFFSNKFVGAAIGIFKENIIARDLGLKDKSEVEQNTKVSINNYSDLPLDELEKRLNERKAKLD